MKKIAKKDTKLRFDNETVRSLSRPTAVDELLAVDGGSSDKPTAGSTRLTCTFTKDL